MVERIKPVEAVFFVLLAVCGAVCQNAGESLPDAPSESAATQKLNFNGIIEKTRSPLGVAAAGGNVGLMRQGAFADPDKTVSNQKEPDTMFRKYVYPSSLKRQSGHHAMSNGSLMGRATSAAARPLITRDDSGKARLNTSYLLRTLTVVAKDTASTPYWRRSRAGPISDFGSNVGSDAGMNLWREFGPGVQRLMKNHTPKFVFKITEHIAHS
jgi:hypothetical protein